MENKKSEDRKVPKVSFKKDRPDQIELQLDDVVVSQELRDGNAGRLVIKSAARHEEIDSPDISIDEEIGKYLVQYSDEASGVIDAGRQSMDELVKHSRPRKGEDIRRFVTADTIRLPGSKSTRAISDGIPHPLPTEDEAEDSSVYHIIEIGKTVEYRVAFFGGGELVQAAADYCFPIIGEGDEIVLKGNGPRISNAKDIRWIRYVKRIFRTDHEEYRGDLTLVKRDLKQFRPNYLAIYRNTNTAKNGRRLYDMPADELQRHINILHAGLNPGNGEPFALAFLTVGRSIENLPEYNPNSKSRQILNAYNLKTGDLMLLNEMEMERLVIRLKQEVRRSPDLLREVDL